MTPTTTTCTPNAAGICQTDHSKDPRPAPRPGIRRSVGVPFVEQMGG
jgi:hypothetical protein